MTLKRVTLVDINSLFNSFKSNGFSLTAQKAMWALETRGIRVPFFKNELWIGKKSELHMVNWTRNDLENRSRNIRENPPRTLFRTFAFYLPQFHVIPENEKWWGNGFTEWTNVKKSKAQFEDHYQPHIPLDKNYYDLKNVETMKEQSKLAKSFGIDAFAIYYYWFDGKTLLEEPLRNILKNNDLDFPFFLCWANESWTRNWDGKPNDVLMPQNYREDFAEQFIRDALIYFKNRNYQTYEGRPILLVYRPEQIPNPKDTTEIWRKIVQENGFKNPYLIAVNSFKRNDPESIGFDAVTNFAPNNFGLSPQRTSDFKGKIYDYEKLTKTSQVRSNKHPHYRSVCPSWDNSPRRGNQSTVFKNSSPDSFRNWFYDEAKLLIAEQAEHSKRLIFINSWNEWGEGCHLEPDEKYGYQWLHAVADVKEQLYAEFLLLESSDIKFSKNEKKYFDFDKAPYLMPKPKLILVTHDMNPNGAQMNALSLLKEFKSKGLEVQLISLTGGKLRSEFEKLSRQNFTVVDEIESQDFVSKIREFSNSGFSMAVINSIASGKIANVFEANNIEIITLVHELPETIEHYNLQGAANSVAKLSKILVFPSQFVKNRFEEIYESKAKTLILPQGLYQNEIRRKKPLWDQTRIKLDLKIADSDHAVIGIGYGDYRKGFDSFCEVAKVLPQHKFIWVGDLDTSDIRIREAISLRSENVLITEFSKDISQYLSIASCLLLTSRQDPFPSVVLEALSCGIPVTAIFQNTGMDEILKNLNLPIAKSEKPEDLVSCIEEAIRLKSSEFGSKLEKYIEENHNFRKYAVTLMKLSGAEIKTITAFLPSYNYERFLPSRVQQIENQSISVDEIILIDDASTDQSAEIAIDILRTSKIKNQILVNRSNSGSPFRNWVTAINNTDSDYLWIAEMDDFASRYLVESTTANMSDETALVYCKSKQINEFGEIISEDFTEYLSRIPSRNFDSFYSSSGEAEIRECLAIQNTIPNISAVIFKSATLTKISKDFESIVEQYKTAADWVLYFLVLQNGDIAYIPYALNAQRRHSLSVIGSSDQELLMEEIKRVQKLINEKYMPNKDTVFFQKEFTSSIIKKRNN